MDFGGDGTVDTSGEARWTDAGLVSGYFFADYSPGGLGNTFALDTREFSLRAPFKASTTIRVQDELRIQLTRPPADAVSWTWRLVDKGRVPGGSGLPQEVPATVQKLGALILIKPSQPLRYSRRYELLVDTGTPTPQGQLMRATTGATLEIYQGTIGYFETLNHLNPRPTFYQTPAYLSPERGTRVGTPPQPEGAPPVTYRWAPLAGQPVVTSTPDAVQTDVSLGAGASGIGTATLRLTMTLADGTSESEDILIRTVRDTAGPWASVVHVPDMGLTRPEQRHWGGPAVGQLVIAGNGDRLAIRYSDTAGPAGQYANWSVQLRSGDGTALRPGTYTDAWSASAVGLPAGANQLEFTLRDIGFSPRGSDFTILEIEADGSGAITRLALDFVVRGVGDFTPTTGSVRWNSALPLAP